MGRKILLTTAIMMAFAAPGFANVSGASIVHGDIFIDSSDPANVVITQKSETGIINWDDFSIAEGETVEFKHSSEDAVTLNRVISGKQSDVNGNLYANGKIILVNTGAEIPVN